MLWLGLIDILFLLIGAVLGHIICYTVHHDMFLDECRDCEYYNYVMEAIEHEKE